MAILQENDDIRQYKYRVSNITLKFPNEGNVSINTNNLTSMNIMEDYEEFIFPIFSITLAINRGLYYKIISNKNDVSINLKIDKFYTNRLNNNESIKLPFINGNFKLILENENENLETNIDRSDNNTFDNLSNEIRNEWISTRQSVTFYLYDLNTINGTKKNINGVYTNCTVADILAYIFTQANIKNVLMSQPDNNNKYDQLLIPPLSILSAIKFIDQYYGIYKRGSMIFFGLDYTYIIPYDGKCHVYPRNNNTKTNIIVPKANSTNNTLGNLHRNVDDLTDYVIVDYTNISIRNTSITNDYLVANNIKSVDSFENKIKLHKSSAKGRNDDNFTRYFENHTENEFLPNTYVAQTTALSTTIDCRVSNIDITTLMPNRKFNFIFEDSSYIKKYNNEYIISSATYRFDKSGDNDLLLTATLSFKQGK